MRRLLKYLPRTAIVLLWILLILYPNPLLLTRSIVHAVNPPIDPMAVEAWVNELPNDPAYIERQVLDRFVPYAVPWQTYGVPWYYPTTSEVVAAGQGDCEARMLVLASILKAKGIPYRIEASIDHIWVEYPGKQPNRMENGERAVLRDGALRLPERWDWELTYRIEKEYLWDAMPLDRKLLLFGGLLLILLWRRVAGALGTIGAIVPGSGFVATLWCSSREKAVAWTALALGLNRISSNPGSGDNSEGDASASRYE